MGDGMREYLEAEVAMHRTMQKPAGFVYLGAADYVLQHGRELDLANAIVRPGTPKHCFWNAREAARKFGWQYWEGYALSIIPMLHAWCVDQAGRVVEVTWKQLGESYYGVDVPLKWLNPKAPYLDDWMAGWPAFQKRRLECVPSVRSAM